MSKGRAMGSGSSRTSLTSGSPTKANSRISRRRRTWTRACSKPPRSTARAPNASRAWKPLPACAPAIVDTGDTLTDFMLGVRYTFAFGRNWGLTLRGDGSWGDSDGTWNASALAQYHLQHGSWAFGYRYLDVNLKPNGNRVSINMSGPVVGYAFRF